MFICPSWASTRPTFSYARTHTSSTHTNTHVTPASAHLHPNMYAYACGYPPAPSCNLAGIRDSRPPKATIPSGQEKLQFPQERPAAPRRPPLLPGGARAPHLRTHTHTHRAHTQTPMPRLHTRTYIQTCICALAVTRPRPVATSLGYATHAHPKQRFQVARRNCNFHKKGRPPLEDRLSYRESRPGDRSARFDVNKIEKKEIHANRVREIANTTTSTG